MRLKRKAMQASGRKWRRLGSGIITLLFVSFFFASCTAYNPSVYPSYNCLNPGAEVKANPLGFVIYDTALGVFIISWDAEFAPDATVDYTIVNRAFMFHYRELWDEVKKLRILLNK